MTRQLSSLVLSTLLLAPLGSAQLSIGSQAALPLGFPLTYGGGGGVTSVCNPLQIGFTQPVYDPFQIVALNTSGVPGTFALLLFDLDDGPTVLPGIGTANIGFSPVMLTAPIAIPASGQLLYQAKDLCLGFPEVPLYAQAVSLDPLTLTACLSNPASTIIRDSLGACSQPPCRDTLANSSNFNGTAIRANSFLWFNTHVKVSNLPVGGSVGFRNSHIVFDAGGQHYDIPVPDGVITVSATATLAATSFDPAFQIWRTTVPAGCADKNIFLSGVALPTGPNGLPGGISPVTWYGDFVLLNPGASLSWQWSAAVYTSFSADYNQLAVKAVDSCPDVFGNNSNHAGTPQNYRNFVVGGARGGGGSNFTGSWSGTESFKCR